MVDRKDLISAQEKIAAQKELEKNESYAKALIEQMHSQVDSERGADADTGSEAMEKIKAYLKSHSETVDYEYLVRGATLVCRCGSHKRCINLPKCHGIYYYDYSIYINRYLQEKKLECWQNGIKYSYAEYVEKQVGSGNYNPSFGQYIGAYVLDPAWWFYKQVKPEGEWDLKVKEKWIEAFRSLPYRSTKFQFVYNSQVIDSENLGNITFGYWGKASGFSDERLFMGGGFANNPLTMLMENYGESEEDHAMIQRGIDMYLEEHPYYEAKW